MKGRRAHILSIGLLFTVIFMVLGGSSARGQRVYADGETHGGTVLLSSTTDPTFSINYPDTTDYSSVRATISILGLLGEAWQNITFPTSNKPSSNTPVTIKFGSVGSLLSLADGITLIKSNGGTDVGTGYSGSSLLNVLASNQVGWLTISQTGFTYDGIKIKINAAGIGLALTGRLYYAFFITSPNISSQTICNGSAATLTVTNPQSGYTYNWYSTSTGGTALQSSTSTTFSPSPNLTATTTYYAEAVETATGTSYYSGRTAVTVTVNNPPTNASAGTNQSLCSTTTTTLTGNTPATGTGAWSQLSGPNTAGITSPASATTGVTGMVAGTYVFRWTISNGACTASTSDVTIVVSTTPTIILGTAPSACQEITSAPMIYTGTTGSPVTYSITWSGAALAAGFLNVSDVALPASPITLTIPGSAPMAAYSGSLTVKNAAGCDSTSVPFTFTVHPKPATPNFSITTSN